MMRDLRQGLNGLVVALISIGLVFGGLSLSLQEGPKQTVNLLTSTLTAPGAMPMPATYTSTPAASPVPGQSPIPSLTVTITQTLTASITPAPPPSCPAPPANWVPYTIQIGDSLNVLAAAHNTRKEEIIKGNCLLTETLLPGTILYLPALAATATITPTPIILENGCPQPPGWVLYAIQHGDTLIGLSKIFNVSIGELQVKNCMGSSTLLVHGQSIFVPFAITVVPATPTLYFAAPTATPIRTRTTVPLATITSAITATETSTFLATIQPTLTQSAPTLTSTTNSQTNTPAATSDSTQIPISTITLTPTSTP